MDEDCLHLIITYNVFFKYCNKHLICSGIIFVIRYYVVNVPSNIFLITDRVFGKLFNQMIVDINHGIDKFLFYLRLICFVGHGNQNYHGYIKLKCGADN